MGLYDLFAFFRVLMSLYSKLGSFFSVAPSSASSRTNTNIEVCVPPNARHCVKKQIDKQEKGRSILLCVVQSSCSVHFIACHHRWLLLAVVRFCRFARGCAAFTKNFFPDFQWMALIVQFERESFGLFSVVLFGCAFCFFAVVFRLIIASRTHAPNRSAFFWASFC